MSGVLFLVLAAVVLVAGWLVRRRVRRIRTGRGPIVSDELLRSILDDDALRELDDAEPLDEDEIRKAEDEFWDDEWRDSDEWRG
jgi:hypothetical protein